MYFERQRSKTALPNPVYPTKTNPSVNYDFHADIHNATSTEQHLTPEQRLEQRKFIYERKVANFRLAFGLCVFMTAKYGIAILIFAR